MQGAAGEDQIVLADGIAERDLDEPADAPEHPPGAHRAADHRPGGRTRGVGWLLSETGVPRRIKAAYLDDDTIKYLAAYAARLRHQAAA